MENTTEIRTAIARTTEIRTEIAQRMVAAYLPSNYRVLKSTKDGGVIIEGVDFGGWTLDNYVIPRLASGLIGCREVATPDEPEMLPGCEENCYCSPGYECLRCADEEN